MCSHVPERACTLCREGKKVLCELCEEEILESSGHSFVHDHCVEKIKESVNKIKGVFYG